MSNILNIFSVKDGKAEAYITPFFLPNTEMAIRTFGASCSDKQHTFGLYPQDFHLYHLGTFDMLTCSFKSIPPKLLITGIEAKKLFKAQYITSEEQKDLLDELNNLDEFKQEKQA